MKLRYRFYKYTVKLTVKFGQYITLSFHNLKIFIIVFSLLFLNLKEWDSFPAMILYLL